MDEHTSVTAQAISPTATVSAKISQNSVRSAEVIVPLLHRWFQPRSVVDFGCKHGEWLTAFRQYSCETVLGLDRAIRLPYLLLEPGEFRVTDLNQPLTLTEHFDLAVCVEVAEHLKPSAAGPLVTALTTAAPLVLFSGALPGQGGHGHLNEQSRRYWHDLFAERQFAPIDCIRPHIWQNPEVAFWYRQNLFLYASDEGLERHPLLADEAQASRAMDLELVHVDLVERLSLGGWIKHVGARALSRVGGRQS